MAENPAKQPVTGETAGYPAGFALVVEKQNINETEGSEANKI